MSKQPIDYKEVLADLQTKRGAIDAAVIAVRALISTGADHHGAPEGGGMPENEAGKSVAKLLKSEVLTGMTIGDAAYSHLKERGEPQSISEIAAGLKIGGFHHDSQHFNNTLRVALRRREGREPGYFRRFGKKWGLAEWSPATRRRMRAIEEMAQAHEEEKPEG